MGRRIAKVRVSFDLLEEVQAGEMIPEISSFQYVTRHEADEGG